MTNPIVVDLSHWNPHPDWQALKAGGTVGVILKATEGATNEDATFYQRAHEAFANGLCVATYHFMRPGDVVAQMDHYLTVTDRIMPLGSRVCLDHEDPDVSLAYLEEAVMYIRETRPDLYITIYSGHVIKEQLEGEESDTLAAHTDLWLAQYTENTPTWPKHVWPNWSLWQFTDSATVTGISEPVDGNKWWADDNAESLIDWFHSPGEDHGPQPIEPEAIMLTLPKGQRLFVNGKEIDYG